MEGLAILIVVVFILIKFNGLVSRSTETIEAGLGSLLTAAEQMSDLAEDSSKTYAYKVKEHNSAVRGQIKEELSRDGRQRATFAELDALL